MKRLFLSAVIFFYCSSIVLSQDNTSSDHHFIESSYQAGSLFNSYASFLDISIGRVFLNRYSVGLVFHKFISDLSSRKLKPINFWYIGHRFTRALYSGNLLTCYFGGTVGVGNYNYSPKTSNTVTSGAGIVPELGIRYKVTDHFKLDLKTSLFNGVGGDFKTVNIFSIRFGVRFIQ